jgi:peptidyl-prolyl cis-trans isomerase B (cyclophilin B)
MNAARWRRASTWVVLAACALACGEPSGLEEIERLEDARDLGRGRLIEYASSPAGGLRARAARAMGRISDPEVLPTLTHLLDDRDPAVVREAAFACGLIARERPEHGEQIARILSPHIDDLGDLPPATAREVVWAMGRVSEFEPEWWRRATHDRRVPVVAEIALALRGNDSADEQVLTWLRHGDPEVRWRAAYAARDCEGADEELGRALGDEDPRVRRQACVALGHSGSTRASTLLQQHLDVGEFDSGVVVAALNAFRSAAPSPSTTNTIEKYMHSPVQYTRAAACRALGAIGGFGAEAALLRLVGDVNSLVRTEAALGLSQFDLPSCRDALARLAVDPSPAVRAAAIRGVADPELIAAAAHDSAAVVRVAAVDARAATEGGSVDHALDDPDPRVVGAAIAAIGRRPAVEWPTASLAELYRPGADPRVRLALFRAVQGRDDAVACDFEAFFRDQSPHIRRAATLAARASTPDGGCDVPDLDAVSRRGRSISGAGRAIDADRLARRASIVTDEGTIDVQLFPRSAPHAVARFLDLAGRGVFDGTAPCHIAPDSILVMGCDAGLSPLSTGRSLRRELGPRRIERGVLATWEPIPDGADAQFLVALGPLPELDGRVTVFAEVELGMDVVERLTPDSRVLRVSAR